MISGSSVMLARMVTLEKWDSGTEPTSSSLRSAVDLVALQVLRGGVYRHRVVVEGEDRPPPQLGGRHGEDA